MTRGAKISAETLKKVALIREWLKKDPSMRHIDVKSKLKEQFKTGVQSVVIRELIQEVRPDYKGKYCPRHHFVDAADGTAGLDSTKKVKASAMYRAMIETGLNQGVARVATLRAMGFEPFVPDFDKSQLDKAKKVMLKYGKVAFKLTKHHKVMMINPKRVVISS